MMLPNGWKEVKLGDICDKIGSGSTPKGGREVYLNAGIPIIRSQNVLNGFLDLSDVAFISDEQHAKMKGTWVCPGDILLNITGASIGRSCVVPANIKTANVNQHVCIIRLKECADACYVCNLILSKDVQKQIELLSVGGGRQGLNFQQIASFSFVLPPLEEQKKMAEILSVWDKAIEKTEKLIEAKETQKKALISNLTDGDTIEKFKLGNVVIDKSKWNKKNFSEVFEFLSTNTYSREYMSYDGGNVKNIHYGDVLVKYAEVLDVETTDIPYLKPDVDTSKMALLRSGDIVIADTAEDETVGKTVEVVNVGQNLIVSGLHTMFCRPQRNLFSPGWLGYYINSNDYHKQLIPLMAGIKVSSIAKKDIVNTTILIPSLSEQKIIVEILSDASKEIDLLKRQLDNYKKQKQGLMQKLLTGQWRVK